MTNFDNLKNSYMFAIHSGLDAKIDYQNCKLANEFIHKFCEIYIDNSNYSDDDKMAKKQELNLLKEALSKEIESSYQHA